MATKQKPARTPFYDNLKFVLIAFVVSGHFLEMMIDSSNSLMALWRTIYMFHMPAFLFVGGMFAKKLYTQEKGLRVNVIAFYLVMGVLFYTGLWLEKSLYSQPNFNLFTISSIPWYFFVMAALGAATTIVAKIRGGAKVVIPVSIALALIVGMEPKMGDFLCLGRIFSYAPFYFAGYFLSIQGYVDFIQRNKKRIWPVVLSILLIIGVFLLFRYAPKSVATTMANLSTGHNPYSDKYFPMYICMGFKFIDIVLAALMTVAISLLTPTGHCLISGLGARTLQVYIAHPFIYYPIGFFELLNPLFPYAPWSGLVVFACGWVLAAILAWPKWPENAFQAFRKKIQIDNAA